MKARNGLTAALAALLSCLASVDASAQAILLKTGQRVETLGLRRDRDIVMGKVQVGSSSGEVGYQVVAIAKIEFPEPKALKTATELLSQGQPDKALAEIDPVVKYYAAFRDIVGGWWAQAALIRVSALSALQRDAEAEPIVAELQKFVSDPEVVRAANLRRAGSLIRKGDYDKAGEICDAAIKESAEPSVLAEAWKNNGDILFSKKDWDNALLAYLHVPVFYSEEKLFLPAALLGSARAYRRLEDFERARKAFAELTTTFPKSAEATLAQAEIQKLPPATTPSPSKP